MAHGAIGAPSDGRRHVRTTWFGLAVTPALGYPLFTCVLFSWDLLAGERLVVHYLRYDRHLLWDTFWSDYLRALPAFYLWAAAGLVTWLLLAKLSRMRSPRWLIPINAASGWVIGAYLTGGWFGSGALAVTLVGAVVGAPLTLFVARLRSVRGA